MEADDTDAICIGTWPYMHCPVTLAALDEGKHVLTEARMAMNAEEARDMLSASVASPSLVTQIVPAPMTLKFDRTILDLIAGGYLGEILAVDLQGHGGEFIDWDSPMHWRQDRDLSGFNIYEHGDLVRDVDALDRAGDVRCRRCLRLTCGSVGMTTGGWRGVTIPDHVEVLCRMACGAQARLRFSAVTGHAPPSQVWLFGSEGTLHLDMGDGKAVGGTPDGRGAAGDCD